MREHNEQDAAVSAAPQYDAWERECLGVSYVQNANFFSFRPALPAPGMIQRETEIGSKMVLFERNYLITGIIT